MPTTFTPHLNLAKPGHGDRNWDALINGNWDVLDNISQGVVSFGTLASGTNTATLFVGSGGARGFRRTPPLGPQRICGGPPLPPHPPPPPIFVLVTAPP